MGPMVRSFDWSQTSIGPRESWSIALKAHVSMMLALPTAAIIFWGEEQVQIYNDGFLVIMGPRHPHHLGSTLRECWPEAYSRVDPWMKRVTQNGEVVIFERSLFTLTRHGFTEECYFSFTFSPLKNDEGNIEGLLEIVTEETESILFERRVDMLRKIYPSANAMSNTIQHFMDVISSNLHDIRFACIFLTPGPVTQLALAGHLGVGEQIKDGFGFTELMRCVREVFSTNIGHEINNVQNLMPHAPLGPWPELTQEAILLPIRYNDSTPTKGVVIFGISPQLPFNQKYRAFLEDAARAFASALEHDEQRRRFTQEEFRTLADNAQDCITRFDRKGRYVYANPFYTKLLQLPAEAIIGKTVIEMNRSPTNHEWGSKIQEVFDSGELKRFDHKTVDGRWLDMQIIPELHGDEIETVLSIARDVTERKLLEAELRAAIDVRDEFLLIASHELKTPVTTIKLQIQTLLRFLKQSEGTVDVVKLIQFGNKIDDYVRRLTALIDDLLEVSRICAGKLSLNFNETDLSSLLDEAIDRAIPMLHMAGITVDKKIERPVMARVDKLRMEQVISNLLSNVEKYAPGQPIEIQLQSQLDKVTLSVQDLGPGIPSHYLEQIFDRFERVSADMTRTDGLGMGLYIARQIINAHGGKIWAESGVGRGSCFMIEIPIAHERLQ
ncbi:MAG TPA: hypothetical protein DDY37_07795 [Legionella sp.]|nr:hypothetical protein [Legionella sp.]